MCPPLLQQQALINLGLVLEFSAENRRLFIEFPGWVAVVLAVVHTCKTTVIFRPGTQV
jgi:hypothetical protein